jgi:hypothetical protein
MNRLEGSGSMGSSLDEQFGQPLFTLDVDGRLVTICLNRPEREGTPLTLPELRAKVAEELRQWREKGDGPIAFREGLDKAFRELPEKHTG